MAEAADLAELRKAMDGVRDEVLAAWACSYFDGHTISRATGTWIALHDYIIGAGSIDDVRKWRDALAARLADAPYDDTDLRVSPLYYPLIYSYMAEIIELPTAEAIETMDRLQAQIDAMRAAHGK